MTNYCKENVHNQASDYVNERLVDMTKQAVGGFSAMLPATADRHALALRFYQHCRTVLYELCGVGGAGKDHSSAVPSAKRDDKLAMAEVLRVAGVWEGNRHHTQLYDPIALVHYLTLHEVPLAQLKLAQFMYNKQFGLPEFAPTPALATAASAAASVAAAAPSHAASALLSMAAQGGSHSSVPAEGQVLVVVGEQKLVAHAPLSLAAGQQTFGLAILAATWGLPTILSSEGGSPNLTLRTHHPRSHDTGGSLVAPLLQSVAKVAADSEAAAVHKRDTTELLDRMLSKVSVDAVLMDAMKAKVTVKAAANEHHASLPSRALALQCCNQTWHLEAAAAYVEETHRPALRVREERDAKVAPLVAAVRRGDYEAAVAQMVPTEELARFERLHATWIRFEAEAVRTKAHSYDVWARYAAKDSEVAVVREAITQALQALRLAVQARKVLEQDGACGFVAATTTTHAAEETVATGLGVSTQSLLAELHTAHTVAWTGKSLFVRALQKSDALPSPVRRRAVQVARSLKPNGGVALERGQRATSYPYDSRTLPFATGQAQAWDASLVGTGVSYCSDRTAPAGQTWICGEIVRSLASQKFELRLVDKQKLVVKLPVCNVRYLPVKAHVDAPPAAPPPLPVRTATVALQLLQSTSAGGAAEAVVAECSRALSAKEIALVRKTWAEPHDDSEVPCPGHNHSVTRSNFATLRPCTEQRLGRDHWLGDVIINPLCLLLRLALGGDSNVVIFLSNLSTLLLRADYRIDMPRLVRELRAFANVELFKQQQWLLPIHLKKHWFVVQAVFLHW